MNNKIKNTIEATKRELYDAYRNELKRTERKLTTMATTNQQKLMDIIKKQADTIQTLQNYIDDLHARMDAYDSQSELKDTIKTIVTKHKQAMTKQNIKQNIELQNDDDLKALDEAWNALNNMNLI